MQVELLEQLLEQLVVLLVEQSCGFFCVFGLIRFNRHLNLAYQFGIAHTESNAHFFVEFRYFRAQLVYGQRVYAGY